jgi:hypothetical protein
MGGGSSGVDMRGEACKNNSQNKKNTEAGNLTFIFQDYNVDFFFIKNVKIFFL